VLLTVLMSFRKQGNIQFVRIGYHKIIISLPLMTSYVVCTSPVRRNDCTRQAVHTCRTTTTLYHCNNRPYLLLTHSLIRRNDGHFHERRSTKRDNFRVLKMAFIGFCTVLTKMCVNSEAEIDAFIALFMCDGQLSVVSFSPFLHFTLHSLTTHYSLLTLTHSLTHFLKQCCVGIFEDQ
jgi:hypothetical protein